MNKFVLLALVGANASTVTVPTVSWNTTATDAAGANAQAWAGRNQRAEAADQQATNDDFTRAWARFEVGSYVNFGKNFSPIVAQQAEIYQNLTPSGNCNQEAATNCLNTYFHSEMHHHNQHTMNQCVINTAHCNNGWDDMSAADRNAFARRYNTNVEAAGTAYGNIWNTFTDNLRTAQTAHQARQQAINNDFMGMINQVAGNMGCDTMCMQGCMSRNAGDRCYSRCHCGQGAVSITNTPVNSMALVKEQYGDLNQMNEEELTEFSQMVNNAQHVVANRN